MTQKTSAPDLADIDEVIRALARRKARADHAAATQLINHGENDEDGTLPKGAALPPQQDRECKRTTKSFR